MPTLLLVQICAAVSLRHTPWLRRSSGRQPPHSAGSFSLGHIAPCKAAGHGMREGVSMLLEARVKLPHVRWFVSMLGCGADMQGCQGASRLGLVWPRRMLTAATMRQSSFKVWQA